VDSVHLPQLRLDETRRCDDFACRFNVPFASVVHHGGPASRDNSATPATGEHGSGVDAALPVRHDEVLVMLPLLTRIHEDGGALGRIPVFVRVRAYAGHSCHIVLPCFAFKSLVRSLN